MIYCERFSSRISLCALIHSLRLHLINFTFISHQFPSSPSFFMTFDIPMHRSQATQNIRRPTSNRCQETRLKELISQLLVTVMKHKIKLSSTQGNHSSFSDNVSWYAEREERHKELVDETAEVGLMFASKAFVQLLVNPIVGPLTHK